MVDKNVIELYMEAYILACNDYVTLRKGKKIEGVYLKPTKRYILESPILDIVGFDGEYVLNCLERKIKENDCKRKKRYRKRNKNESKKSESTFKGN